MSRCIPPLILCVVMLAAAVGCSESAPKQATDKYDMAGGTAAPKPDTPKPNPPKPMDDLGDPANYTLTATTQITTSGGPCHGPCPKYDLSIYGDGSVVYEGKDNVGVTGVHKKKIPLEKVQAIFEIVKELRFLELPARTVNHKGVCPKSGMHYGFQDLTVKTDGREHTVDHYKGCKGSKAAERLLALNQAILEATEADKWLARKPKPKQP